MCVATSILVLLDILGVQCRRLSIRNARYCLLAPAIGVTLRATLIWLAPEPLCQNLFAPWQHAAHVRGNLSGFLGALMGFGSLANGKSNGNLKWSERHCESVDLQFFQ